MNTLYKKIVETFNANKNLFTDNDLPEIRQIDINIGQPDNPEAFEVFLPGIYIDWAIDKPNPTEPSVLTLSFHILQEPGAATENYSTNIDKGLEYILVIKNIKYILNGLKAENTTGLTYLNERQNITEFFRYHIISYQCFIDDELSLTKGTLIDVELLDYKKNFNIKQKQIPEPNSDIVDTY